MVYGYLLSLHRDMSAEIYWDYLVCYLYDIRLQALVQYCAHVFKNYLLTLVLSGRCADMQEAGHNELEGRETTCSQIPPVRPGPESQTYVLQSRDPIIRPKLYRYVVG
jgi:hypothetical protein